MGEKKIYKQPNAGKSGSNAFQRNKKSFRKMNFMRI